MPQDGSAFAMAAKVSSDFLYQKEWSRATARLKSDRTVAAHEVGKLTLPRTAGSEEPCSCCGASAAAKAAPAQNKNASMRRQNRMICFVSPPPKPEAAKTVAPNYILNHPMKCLAGSNLPGGEIEKRWSRGLST